MVAEQDTWDLIPDDQHIYLTKHDIDNLMNAILQVQLIAVNASGCIRALKEEDNDKYETAWNAVKLAALESRKLLFKTYSTIAERNSGSSDAQQQT